MAEGSITALIGPNDERLGPRFPDLVAPYDRALQDLALRVALEENIVAHRGVYVGVTGPNLETRAEDRFLRAIGADLGVRAIVEGRVQLTGTQLWVEVRLVDAQRDRKIWVDDFAGDAADRRALERRVATAIGDVIAARFPATPPVE